MFKKIIIDMKGPIEWRGSLVEVPRTTTVIFTRNGEKTESEKHLISCMLEVCDVEMLNIFFKEG